jgi:hypothetical protein
MAGAKPVLDSPQGVEVRQMVGADGKTGIFVVINHEPVEQVMQLPWPVYEHLNGLALEGKLRLAPYGVVLLTRAEKKASDEPQAPAGQVGARAGATSDS